MCSYYSRYERVVALPTDRLLQQRKCPPPLSPNIPAHMIPVRHDMFPAHYVFALLRCYAELVGSYRRFGSRLCRNVNSTLRNILEERRPHLHSDGSQRSRQ
jgi:hypothetical protein